MFILLPLSLIGVGFLVYAVFAGATLALPIGAGLAAGFAASALGVSPLASVAIGVVTFVSLGTVHSSSDLRTVLNKANVPLIDLDMQQSNVQIAEWQLAAMASALL